ncbi:hypothetical protein LINGRAHAP2_LOCUS18755 [Linum grandiflorum]
MASFGEAQESGLPFCLRNKNLYLGYRSNSQIVGIKLDDRLGLSGKEEPRIIEDAVILGRWDIHEDDGVPIAMRFLVKDSKVYAIGGSNHSDDEPCKALSNECLSEPVSMLVYEFSRSADGRPRFSPCSSVPQLPAGMNDPYIVNHMGETYVLYGPEILNQRLSPQNKKLALKYSFLVLEKQGMGWKSLPRPPLLGDESLTRQMQFDGAIGSKLYVRTRRRMFCYDIKNERWEVDDWRPRKFGRDAITLSSLATGITNEVGEPSYVVIYVEYNLYHEVNIGHRIFAALVDEDGKIRRNQLILEATGDHSYIGTMKLIDLGFHKKGSTFALVFASSSNIIGLTVVRVSQLPSLSDGDDEFLKAEVLVNQRYITEKRVSTTGFCIHDAFFY